MTIICLAFISKFLVSSLAAAGWHFYFNIYIYFLFIVTCGTAGLQKNKWSMRNVTRTACLAN